MQEKESKLLYSFCFPFNEQQKCHIKNINTERKNKNIILHSFARKTKVSYYITFFQILLRPFSCDLGYSDRRIILSYCDKRKVTYYMFAKRTIYSFQRTTKVSCYKYLHCRGKTKVSYYITFFQTLLRPFSCDLCYSDRRIILSYCDKRKVTYYVCKKNNIFLSTNNKSVMLQIFTLSRKNKSIKLHHVLPNSPENVFLAAFVMLKSQQQWRTCQTKYRIIFQVKEGNRRFIWLP